ncbi:MAG: hypothetical protein ACP5N3_01495 [Candidatus Nanoarchaeia archaeon]
MVMRKGKPEKKSEEEQMAFFVKVGEYIRNHPEFVEELEERMEMEEHPERAADIDYLIKKNLKGFGNNADVIADNVTDFLFKKNKKDSWFRTTTQDYVKSLVSGYLSNYLGK